MVDAKLLTVIALVIVVGASLGSTYLRQSNSENGTAATSVYLQGKLTSEGQDPLSIEIFYTANPDLDDVAGARSKFSVQTAEGGTITTDIQASFAFAYDSSGALTYCHEMNSAVTDPIMSLLGSGNVEAIANNDLSEFSVDYEGNTLTFAVHSAILNSDGSEIPTPTVQECLMAAAGGVPRRLGAERRILTQAERTETLLAYEKGVNFGATIKHGHLFQATQDAYVWHGFIMPESGWTSWKTCIGHNMGVPLMGNARAEFLYKDGVMVVSIAGTDPWDVGDILADANFFMISVPLADGTTISLHQGFHGHMEQIQACLNAGVDELAGYNIPISYTVGHSLGGASAAVYEQVYGVPEGRALGEVVTFGAPTTRYSRVDETSCTITGTAYRNHDDPITGDAFGFFKDVYHDISTANVLKRALVCKKYRWWFCVEHEIQLRKEAVQCEWESAMYSGPLDYWNLVTIALRLENHLNYHGDYPGMF